MWLLGAAVVIMACTIFANYFFGGSVVSFSGKVELATVSVSSTEPQYEWSLSGAYICYDPEWGVPNLEAFGQPRGSGDDRMCGGAFGTSTRKHLYLDEQVKLAFISETTIEVAVSDPPAHAEASSFARGKLPDHILIIKGTTAISADDKCGTKASGRPILVDTVDGERRTAELPLEAEIHVPIVERTLMPFVGRISLGQSNSSDTPNLLRSGTIAIYRPFMDLFILEDPQLVSETHLFPGDVVKFQDTKGCLSPSAGFLRASEDEQGAYLDVVASVRSQDGVAFVQRPTPGAAVNTGHFAVKLRASDAVFTHPMTLWLGALVTGFVIAKEWAAALKGAGRSVGGIPVKDDSRPVQKMDQTLTAPNKRRRGQKRLDNKTPR
jgi:hypothetical protein